VTAKKRRYGKRPLSAFFAAPAWQLYLLQGIKRKRRRGILGLGKKCMTRHFSQSTSKNWCPEGKSAKSLPRCGIFRYMTGVSRGFCHSTAQHNMTRDQALRQ